MHRIDNPSAASSLPAPKPAGPGGFFTAGNLNTGTDPTIVEYDWLNTVQEEMISIVLKGGLTPDKNNNTQLLQALGTMLTGAWTYVHVSQNLLVPAWATRIEFETVAGGGGGAHAQRPAASLNYASGAGGGAGGYAQAMRNVTPGVLLPVVIGVGGPSDTNGATSSIAFTGQWVVTCTGGDCGTYSAPTNSPGGIGGPASGGDLNVVGTWGGDGIAAGVFSTTGYGGPGPWGGGGRSGNGGGAPGGGPGSGGGGAYDETGTGAFYAGGKGADGLLKYRFLP